MATRNYSSTAIATTITSSISNSATTCSVGATTGFPAAPFVARLDADTAAEELVLVTNVAGTTLTITRGYDSTSGQSHSSGASFRHAVGAIDLREPNVHINSTSGVHGVSGAVVGTTDGQTLTNKTLTAPTIATITNSGTLTLPTGTDTLVGRATADTLTNKTVTSPTLVLSATTSTAAGRLAVDTVNGRLIVGDGAAALNVSADNKTATLTNKTLTTPVIASISNSGTITVPTGTDTLVGRATTDTLTNKTLTAPVISTISNSGTVTLPTGTRTLVGRDTTDTLTNKTIDGAVNTITGVTAAGHAAEAWATGTPVISGTGWVLGNGTLTSKFIQFGKTVHYSIRLTFGSTSAAGSGALTVTSSGFPTGVDLSSQRNTAFDTSAGVRYGGIGTLATNGAFIPRFTPATAGGSDTTGVTANPMTWAVGDVLYSDGTYEAL